MKTMTRWLAPLLALLLVAPAVLAQDLPRAARPEEVGLSSARLDTLRQVLRDHVAQKHIAGAVGLIARNGKVAFLDAVGMADSEAGTPMAPETIFRIASMTKPITSLAVMMLYEDGRFLLSDPVSRFLPEFKSPKVAVRSNRASPLEPAWAVVPARREITIKDLLTHTSGITYQFWGRPYFADLYKKAGVSDGLASAGGTMADNLKKLAALPLTNQPGDAYEYGLNTDVLGHVVEVVSGMTLDRFLQQRIFQPLAMKDTYFFLPEDKLPRLAAVYMAADGAGLRRLGDETVTEGDYIAYSTIFQSRGPRTFLSGGAGLVSTASDYARFCQMLLNGGALDGVRLVSPKTVELMRTNHLGDLAMWLGGPGTGFGLGFGVITDIGRSAQIGYPGTYYWGGFFSTDFWIDPQEKLIGILLTQTRPYDPHNVLRQFRVLATSAIVE
jgi:CubicO group peptidase (beta-lactamase class C family)